MIKFKVKFDKVTDVTEFVKEIDSLDCEADLSCGRYLMPAQSIMAIFSFGILDNFELILYSNDEKLKDKFNRWRVI